MNQIQQLRKFYLHNYSGFQHFEKGIPYKRENCKRKRNDMCYCGSGLKYKKCCMLKEGKNEQY